jgi:hypothetical protein
MVDPFYTSALTKLVYGTHQIIPQGTEFNLAFDTSRSMSLAGLQMGPGERLLFSCVGPSGNADLCPFTAPQLALVGERRERA